MEGSLPTGLVVLWLGWDLVLGYQVGGLLCEGGGGWPISCYSRSVSRFALSLRTLLLPLCSILKSESHHNSLLPRSLCSLLLQKECPSTLNVLWDAGMVSSSTLM